MAKLNAKLARKSPMSRAREAVPSNRNRASSDRSTVGSKI